MYAQVREINAFCTDEHAMLNVRFDVSPILQRFQQSLEKRLRKSGTSILWQPVGDRCQLVIWFLLIDQGNQFLRWLVPFCSPARIRIEGAFSADGSPAQRFVHERRADFGLAGGAAPYMLGVCADRLAKDVAKDILREWG